MSRKRDKANRDNRLVNQPPHRAFQLTATTQVLEQTSGPLPDPSILLRYEEAHPGLAERIVAMAESESTHRRQIEQNIFAAQRHDLNCHHREILLGQIFAFLIGLFVIGCGAYVVLRGFSWPGSVISTTGVAGLVSTFIMGRKAQTIPDEQKSVQASEQNPAQPKPTVASTNSNA